MRNANFIPAKAGISGDSSIVTQPEMKVISEFILRSNDEGSVLMLESSTGSG